MGANVNDIKEKVKTSPKKLFGLILYSRPSYYLQLFKMRVQGPESHRAALESDGSSDGWVEMAESDVLKAAMSRKW